MNKKLYMTLVNAIAKVIVIEGTQKGAYRAKLSAAHKIVRAGKSALESFNKVVDIASIIENVSTPSVPVEQMPKKKAVKKSVEKVSKKVVVKRHIAPKSSIAEPAEKIVFKGISINSMLHCYFEQEQIDTVEEYINRFVAHSNEYTGVHMDEKRHMFQDGMKALENAYDMQGLQTAMVTYFLRDYALKVINKFLTMGIGYRKVNKTKNGEKLTKSLMNSQSYQKASSNSGQIHEHTAMDIYHELLITSYDKTFNVAMFDAPVNVIQTLFFRISNVMQVQMTSLRNHFKVTMNIKGMYNEYMEQSEQLDEQAYDIAVGMDIFTDAELEIIKLRIAGLEKVEVDKVIGKRSDRAFNSAKAKFEQVNGKVEKRDHKAEKAKLAENKRQMLKRQSDAKKAV